LKNTASILTILFLGSCVLCFTSCASEQVKGPLPPVKSEPISASDTNELAPSASNVRTANSYPSKSLAPSQAVHTHPAASAYPAVSASAPMVVDIQTFSNWGGEGLLALLLWLLALLVTAAALRHRFRYHGGKMMAVPQAGFARIGLLTDDAPPAGTVSAKKTPSASALSPDESAPSSPYYLEVNRNRPTAHDVHAQKEIIVTAFFNGREHRMHFSRATTIKKVTAWAIYQFEISEEDHKDAYLAIHGYSAPLIGTAHLGRYVMHDKTKLELDVKTITRVTV
jgi:hypothetical protein